MSVLKFTNVGKHQLQDIPTDAALISISDNYSRMAQVPNVEGRPVLFVDFFPGDYLEPQERKHAMSDVRARRIVDFVIENRDKGHIFVQCGEGRFRSWTICHVMERAFGNTEHCTELSAVKQGSVDRYTRKVLLDVIDVMKKANEIPADL